MTLPELKPGPELDSFLAEHILHWHRDGSWWCDAAGKRQAHAAAFAPSNDDDAAYLIQYSLERNGELWSKSLIYIPYRAVYQQDIAGDYHVAFIGTTSEYPDFSGQGKTKELALCAAALRFLEIKEGNNAN